MSSIILNHSHIPSKYIKQTRKDRKGRKGRNRKTVEIKSKYAFIESPAMTAVEGKG